MKAYGRSKRMKRETLANRMSIIGITTVVIFLAVAVEAKGGSLKREDLECQIKEEEIRAQLEAEEQRTRELQEYKIYVKTKQYAEEVAKDKLGLVYPDEILLKPTR